MLARGGQHHHPLSCWAALIWRAWLLALPTGSGGATCQILSGSFSPFLHPLSPFRAPVLRCLFGGRLHAPSRMFDDRGPCWRRRVSGPVVCSTPLTPLLRGRRGPSSPAAYLARWCLVGGARMGRCSREGWCGACPQRRPARPLFLTARFTLSGSSVFRWCATCMHLCGASLMVVTY